MSNPIFIPIPQIYIPFQTLRLVRVMAEDKVYLIADIQVEVYTGQTVEISKKSKEADPFFDLMLEVTGIQSSLWTYTWLGEYKVEVDFVDPKTWEVHAAVYDTNSNKRGEVTNTIKSSQVIDV